MKETIANILGAVIALGALYFYLWMAQAHYRRAVEEAETEGGERPSLGRKVVLGCLALGWVIGATQ